MTQLNQTFEKLHKPVDLWPLRILVMLAAFGHAGLFMWEPQAYAERIGGFSPLLGFMFVLSICSAMVYGIGFKPRFWLWQLLFSPYISGSVLALMTVLCL